MIVAIDGPAGSGKSTIAREFAARTGFKKLDTGAIYRSVAAICLRENIDFSDTESILKRIERLNLDLDGSQAQTQVIADGIDLSEYIRTAEVDRAVSYIATNASMRAALLPIQRSLATKKDIVAEGRDIGTVVFPDAELKIYLSADARVRAHRRVAQRHEHDITTLDKDAYNLEYVEVLRAIQYRDEQDAQNMIPSVDAVHLDSTEMGITEIVDELIEYMNEKRGA
ncbi:(d)CMP kinase [Collinsella sp. zg1085]|uniref:(d)CMP kinase n=1 Tax=Collinsella sp. zg1085 TaxID=2844380 RepID=UPI001C0E5EA2|nr:(d)CMP kinase [Collinsella sp. zg1085]QWT17024.1 (d)CMP kinase [Collinsella sp. zg1085]